jgi:polysaccharide chain length determinant protein (PEP-CTERM system associated)
LTEAEQRLADFKVKYIDFFSSKTENFSARLQIAKEDVDRAEDDLQDAIIMRDNTRKQLDETPQFLDVSSAPQVVVGGAPQSLQQRIAAMQARLDDLRLMYTDKHPDVLRVQTAMQELINEQQRVSEPGATPSPTAAPRSQVPNPLHAQLGMKLADAESLVASMQRKVENAKETVRDLERKATEAPRVEAEFTSLNRDYQVMKSNYENLLMRRESARIAQAADSSTEPVQFRIIAAPEVPILPSGPQRRLFNSIVLVFGLIAGAGFVVLLSQIDGNISRPEDLAEFSDYSFLGCVSPAVLIESTKKSLLALHGRFGVATAGLIAVFAVFLYWSPNLSNLPQQLATVLL